MKRIVFLLSTFFISMCLIAEESVYTPPLINIADHEDSNTGNFSDMSKAMIFLRAGLYKTSAFTNMGSGNIYYLLMGEFIGSFNMLSKQYIEGWKLDIFHDDDLEPEIDIVYQKYEIEPQARTADNLLPVLGCLAQHPLRYGDIDQNGSAELVVFAQDQYNALNFNLFSTTLRKIIFSARIATYDAVMNDRLSLEEGEEAAASNPLANAPTDGQYLSLIAEDNTRMVRGIEPAFINFSKLYAADFDEDEAHDIVVWRKLYETRLNQDTVRGFKLTRNTLIHYKLVNGEYQKQATTPAVIQGWLAAKQLTWQKGYPSKSECPGQENRLIPEMHDPLLNDPDVLQ